MTLKRSEPSYRIAATIFGALGFIFFLQKDNRYSDWIYSHVPEQIIFGLYAAVFVSMMVLWFHHEIDKKHSFICESCGNETTKPFKMDSLDAFIYKGYVVMVIVLTLVTVVSIVLVKWMIRAETGT